MNEEPLGNFQHTLNQIRGSGELGKGSSPRAKASNNARSSVKAKTTASRAHKPKSGGRLFAEGFTVQPQFSARPGGNVGGLFGQFTPRSTPDPKNPGCSGGPKSITVRHQSKSLKGGSSREIIAHDGVKSKLTEKSTNHLLSKHGHNLGIDDALPLSPNQKPTRYKQVRTRINKANQATFGDVIERVLVTPNTRVFLNVSMRGIDSTVYYTKEYEESGFVIGRHNESEFEGLIMKAQPVSHEQLQNLIIFTILD